MNRVSDGHLKLMAELDKNHTAKRPDSRVARELLLLRKVVEAAKKVDNCHRQNQKIELVNTLQDLTKVLTTLDDTENGK